MRQDVHNHFFYLRRRVEDFPDAGQPAPRWTELDYQAVPLLLDELGTLQRFYQDTVPGSRRPGRAASRGSGGIDLRHVPIP